MRPKSTSLAVIFFLMLDTIWNKGEIQCVVKTESTQIEGTEIQLMIEWL